MEVSMDEVQHPVNRGEDDTYEPPALVELGSLAELTRGSGLGSDSITAGSTI